MLSIKRGLIWTGLTVSTLLLIVAVSMVIMAGVQFSKGEAQANQVDHHQMQGGYEHHDGDDMDDRYGPKDHHNEAMKQGKHHGERKHGGFHVAMLIFAIILTILSIAGIVLSIMLLRRIKTLSTNSRETEVQLRNQMPEVSQAKVDEPAHEQPVERVQTESAESSESTDAQDSDEKKE